MLENIREGVKKPWVKVVIFIIVISFVFAGYFTSAFFLGDPNAVVIVNGESISNAEFQRAYAGQKSRQADYYKATVKTEEDERNFQEGVIQNLIVSKVRELAVKDLGMRLSSSSLRNVIQSDPNYQSADGKYSSALVDRTLVNLQWSREKFKAAYELQETTQQLIKGVFESEFALANEAQADYVMNAQQRSGKALQINFATFKDNITLSDDELAQYYAQNQEAFRLEEKVSVDYLELSVKDLMDKQALSEEAIVEYYQNNIDRFKTEEARQVSHILVLSNDDDAAALKKASLFKSRIEAGEDFAAIATAESDDVPTRETGGDLGVLIAGAMDEDFEAAANALTQVGDVSEPVKSDFGYHLIKLTNLEKGSAKPLDEVKSVLIEELKKSQAEVEFVTLSDKLISASFEVSDTLASAAAVTGLELKKSGFFGLSKGDGLFANADLRNAAFSGDVKDARLNSSIVEVAENHVVVLRLNEYKPSEIQPLDAVKSRIENDLKQQKAKELAKNLADNLLEKLKSKENIESILTENKLSWTELNKVERNNATLPYLTNQQFFKMPKPAAGSVNLKLVDDMQGVTLLLLSDVVQGNWENADEASKKQREQYTNSYFSNAEFTAFIENLRKNADITRNNSNLTQ